MTVRKVTTGSMIAGAALLVNVCGGDAAESGCTCHVCGRRYRVDVLVPDEMWAEIRPEHAASADGGLLCGPCILERIEARGRFAAFNLAPANG